MKPLTALIPILFSALAYKAIAETSLLDNANKSAAFNELQRKIQETAVREKSATHDDLPQLIIKPSPFECCTFQDPKDSPENNYGIRIERRGVTK